jgi:hypothetical protein
MKRVNAAYRAGDAEAIVNLLGQWEASPFGAGSEDDAARSARATRRVGALGDAVGRAQQRLDDLRASELAQLMERAMTAAAAGGDLLADMRHAAEAALLRARARLAELQAA